MYKINTAPKKTRFTRKKKLLLVGVGILAIALIMLCLELTNTTYIFHKKSLIVKHKDTASQNTKGESATSDQSASAAAQSDKSASNSNTDSDNKSETSPSSNSSTLVLPTGTFVSNHHPNLSGKPAPNTLTSDCTTTSGATCQITFTNTNTGETKSLPAQTTDRGGSAYWSWQLQDIGLTSGSWQVKAIATLGSQAKTATDAMNLEVQQ